MRSRSGRGNERRRARVRGRAARAAERLIDPVFIPIIAIGGFFAWMIALTVSKAYAARLAPQTRVVPQAGAGQEEVLAAVEELRREVAELAERVDFAVGLLAGQRERKLGAGP